VSTVRLIQIDGKLPNLALMRLSAWHREQGDAVQFSRSVSRGLFDDDADTVYASTIFKFSASKTARVLAEYPDAIVGGTGVDETINLSPHVPNQFNGLDYSIYPEFEYSLGFTQRGCRLKCPFCRVPKKEGKNRSVSTIHDIWRGGDHPKKLHLLDNDFFGQGEDQWRTKIEEIKQGEFKICLSQGINIRLFDQPAADELATIEYRNSSFSKRRLYTAWDNFKDGHRFFRGVEILEQAGIPPTHLMVYMLVGYDKQETWGRIHERFNRMVDRGIMPYPMVFDEPPKNNSLDRWALKKFQRWAVTGLYRAVPFSDYDANAKLERMPGDDQLVLQYSDAT